MTCTVTCRECGQSLVLNGVALAKVPVFISLAEQKGWMLDYRSFWHCPEHGVRRENEKEKESVIDQ
jgi:hypothetical protein